MGLLLGVDAGTTSLKVGLFDDTGTERAVVVEEYALQTPEPSRAEMDPHLYWSSLVRAVRRALTRARTRPADVEALAVSSQGETLVPVSASGVPLGPAIVWLDNRAVAEAGELAAQLDPGAVYAATGVPTMVPTWPACKLLWWKRHDADLFRSSARFLLVEEFLLQRLTGRLSRRPASNRAPCSMTSPTTPGGSRCSTCWGSPRAGSATWLPPERWSAPNPRGRRGPGTHHLRPRCRRRHGPGCGSRRGGQRRPRHPLREHRWSPRRPGVARPIRPRPQRTDPRLRALRPGHLPLLSRCARPGGWP